MGVSVTTWENGESRTEVRYKGYVVGERSAYHGDGDSFFYAIYFDVETSEFAEYCTGYTPEGLVVDAPAEIMHAWEMEQAARKAAGMAKAARMRITRAIYDAEDEAATPRPGKTVKVVRGRKVPVGTVGTVVRTHDGEWGPRVLLSHDGREEWTSMSNVEVVPA